MKDKWRTTEANIKSESYQIAQIYEIAVSLKNEPENNEKRNKEESKVINKNEFNINIDMGNNNQKKMPNMAHFGGKQPFANRNNNDPFENMKDLRNDYMNIDSMNNPNMNNRNQNYKMNDDIVVNKKKESSSVEKRNPLAWDIPEDKNKINVNKPKPNVVQNNNSKPVSSSRNVSNPSQRLQNNSDVGSVNNKGKPIQKNEKRVDSKKEIPNPKKNVAVAGKEGEKKTFLMERYPPNGVGPDSDLIEMLEREVVDTNPCVRFEDIAELEGAKNILKEAVLLPILMPQYFKV